MSFAQVTDIHRSPEDFEEQAPFPTPVAFEMFANPNGLSQDLGYLAGMQELCDVTFFAGDMREPVYAVKAILAARSRIFHKMLYGPCSVFTTAPVRNTSATSSFAHSLNMGKRSISRVFGKNQSRNLCQRQENYDAGKCILHVKDFDANVFRQLVHYVHTGVAMLQSRTVIGLMNCADHFGLEDLRQACSEYAQRCISLDSVCYLLTTAERYIQYKSTKMLIQHVLEFVDKRGEAVLKLPDIVYLPRHVLDLLLSREDLQASEITKFRAAERWAHHFTSRVNSELSYRQVVAPFMKYVALHQLPTQMLMQDIRPLKVVPDETLMSALAFQADPRSVNFQDLYSATMSPHSKIRRLFRAGSAMLPQLWDDSNPRALVVPIQRSPTGSQCDSGFDDEANSAMRRSPMNTVSNKSKSCTDITCTSITYLKL